MLANGPGRQLVSLAAYKVSICFERSWLYGGLIGPAQMPGGHMKLHTEEIGITDIVVAKFSLKRNEPNVLEDSADGPEASADTAPDSVDTSLLKMLGLWLRF